VNLMDRVVYVDNAATTPVRPEVRKAIEPFLGSDGFGNPSSAHRYGRTARAGVDNARRQIAEALGTRPEQVIFTSGGTEADNLAVLGGALAARSRGKPFRVAVSATEHKAVLESAETVEQLGGEVSILPVDTAGFVDLEAILEVLESGPAVLSTMWVNNEVGTIQRVSRLFESCQDAGTLFHTDAVQAIGKVQCSIADIPGACVSISGHKIGALKGCGALIVPDVDSVAPLLRGGGQQRGVRPGTENVVGIVALGLAVELAVRELNATVNHIQSLRNDLEHRLLQAIPDLHVNGANGERAPHISNISVPGIDSAKVLMHLDLAGICCSTGSACNTGAVSASHVLTAMRIPSELASSAVRFSFSEQNTADDVERIVKVMPQLVANLTKTTSGNAIR
jgi:cysteine desulfurase